MATTGAGPARRLADALGECLDSSSAAVTTFERGPDCWTVELHFPTKPDEAGLRALVADLFGENPAPELTVEPLHTRDWVAASLEGLTPVQAGRFFIHGAHHRADVPPARIAIEIEAALAFGTGHHGTTRGCLVALDRLARASRWPHSVLDIGTGTGVLAIAAAKVFRRPMLATDIDAQAVRVARANARANQATPYVRIVHTGHLHGSAFRRGRYDLVFANILLRPLQRLAWPIGRLVQPGGCVVLSGLLPSHANAALAAYRTQHLYLVRRIDLEGWTTLCLARGTSRRRRRNVRDARP